MAAVPSSSSPERGAESSATPAGLGGGTSGDSAGGHDGRHGGERHFLHSAWTVSALTMLSRVLGLVRDQATAFLLGAGAVNDALTWAWTVPNAFRRLFGEGALSSAFVPVYSRVLEHDGVPRARRVSNQVISTLALFLLLLSGALTLLVLAVPAQTVADLTGKDLLKVELTLRYTALLLPYLAFICVIAQFMGVMNAMGEFAVPALASVILNLLWVAGVIAAAWLLGTGASSAAGAVGSDSAADAAATAAAAALKLEETKAQQGYIIAVSILISGVLQFLWHLPRLRTLGVGFRFVAPTRSPELSAVLAATGPMLIGMGASQLNLLADRSVAWLWLPDGGATHLYYGLRLMQFPQGLVSAALVSAVFPALARMSARGEHGSVVSATSLAIRVNSLLTLPAAAGLIVLAGPIVSLLFEHGHFEADAARHTSLALVGYSLGVPCIGMVMLLTRALYALGDIRTPVRIGLWMVALNVALDLLLVGPLEELGLALATSISTAVTAWLLLVAFRSRMNLTRDERLMGGLLPAVGLTLLMGVVVRGVDAALAGRVPEGLLGVGLRTGAGMGAGLLVYLGLAGRWCPQEWNELARLWRRRPAA